MKSIKVISVIILLLISFVWIVTAYSQAELESANNLAVREIIQNHSSNPTDYNLDSEVLRQEIALISRRVSGVSEKSSCDNIFGDVTATTPNTWVCNNVEALVENGLISTNEYFNPERNISKSEALIMFIRSIGFDFSIDDNSSKNWQEQVVEFAVENNVVESFTDYNTEAKRWRIFKIADYSIKLKEERLEAWTWVQKKRYSDEASILEDYSLTEKEKYCIDNRGKIDKVMECNKMVNVCVLEDGTECPLGDFFKGYCEKGVIVEWGEECRSD